MQSVGDLIQPSRRRFLGGLTALVIGAPAIVRAASLMPVRVPKLVCYPHDLFRTLQENQVIFEATHGITVQDWLYAMRRAPFFGDSFRKPATFDGLGLVTNP